MRPFEAALLMFLVILTALVLFDLIVGLETRMNVHEASEHWQEEPAK